MFRTKSKIDRILSKYPKNEAGVICVGADLLRHDLIKAFSAQEPAAFLKRIKQCMHERPDATGIDYCIAEKGHLEEHVYFRVTR